MVDNTIFGPTIVLNTLGYDTGDNYCVVYLELLVTTIDGEVRNLGDFLYTSMSSKTAYELGILISGPKSSMNARISEKFEDFSKRFLVDLQKAKNDLLAEIEKSDSPEDAKAKLSSFFER